MGEALDFIKSIVRRAQWIERNLERDLAQMDKLLGKIPKDAESTKVDLENIRRSLTLHRLFHLGEEIQSEHCDLDRKVALDPGSIILKIVRTHSIKLWKVLCKILNFFFHVDAGIAKFYGSSSIVSCMSARYLKIVTYIYERTV